MWESNSVKLLGTNIDSQIRFDNHISLLCATANRKLFTIARVTYYLNFDQKRMLIKVFLESQIKYQFLR